MIAAIDDGDVDGGTAQGARRIQPTKSTTNDEHTWHVFQQYVIGRSFGEQVNRTSVSDVRCQMSDVRRQTSNVGCRMSAECADQAKSGPGRRCVAVRGAGACDGGAHCLGRRRGPRELFVNAREHRVDRESVGWPATDGERRYTLRRRRPRERIHCGTDARAAEPGAVRQAQDLCPSRVAEPSRGPPAAPNACATGRIAQTSGFDRARHGGLEHVRLTGSTAAVTSNIEIV